MSSSMTRNLSFSFKIPTTTVQCENLVTAVNIILTKYHTEQLYRDYLNVYNFRQSFTPTKEVPAKMQPERLILCEINAGLWNKAISSAINSITHKTYPHYIITQNFLHFLLNGNSDGEVGLAEEYFHKLLLAFPPRPQTYDYYWPILSESLSKEDEKKVPELGLFFWVLETLTICLKNKKLLETDPNSTPGSKATDSSVYSDENILRVIDNFKGIDIQQTKKPKRKTNSFELPWSGKVNHLLTVLNFFYDILECDFGYWVSEGNFSQEKRPLLSCLLWQNARDIGLNKEVQNILNLYKLVLQSSFIHKFPKLFVVKKLVYLLAEVMRCNDITNGIKYPYFGTHSNNLARQISQILLEHLQEIRSKNDTPKQNYFIVNLKPPWFRLLLCSHLLSGLTGYQCLPELTGVYDILESIVHSEEGITKSSKKSKKIRIAKNSKLIQELKTYKSINSKLGNGKTLLHVACQENNVEKVQALLTFPELDVNATDREGWTALHVAAYEGNASCVRELLLFNPQTGDVQKPVNTRAQGPRSITPLMCAVTAGNADVCQLLLQHTGSVLLEDFNEMNETALELSKNLEVTKILKHYKDNHVWTSYSQKDIHFHLAFKEIILTLCVELVQAYLSTHRTWDVYRTLKESENINEGSSETSGKFKWDYLRYQRDIKRNIYKLRKLMPKLETVPEFKSSKEIFTRLLTFNKT